MIGNEIDKKVRHFNIKGIVSIMLFSVMSIGGFAGDAAACMVTEVTLKAKSGEGEWQTSLVVCMGETVSFQAKCQVEEDAEKRPIKCVFDFGDGSTKTEWYDDEDEGPESAGTYSVETTNDFTLGGSFTVKVKAQRWDPEEGKAIDGTSEEDWPSDECDVTALEVKTVKYQKGTAWIENDVCVLKGTSVTFKAIPEPSDEEWPEDQPEWTVHIDGEAEESCDPGEEMSYTFDKLGTHYVTANCCDSDYNRYVTVQDVKFVEDTDQAYGFDDWTSPDNPWKSVATGGSDTAKAEIADDYTIGNVYFKSVTTAHVTISPSQASGSPQTIMFGGGSEGESEIQANAESVNGDNLAKMMAKAYPAQTKTVRIIKVRLPGGQFVFPPFNSEDLQDRLNGTGDEDGVFNQCVTSLTASENVTYQAEVDYDGNGNGQLDYGTSESNTIIDGAKEDSYDFNLFVVHDIKGPPFAKAVGSKYLFIDSETSMLAAVHEIGHGMGLGHVNGEGKDEPDTENLMAEPWTGGIRLRKGQWDTCNPTD